MFASRAALYAELGRLLPQLLVGLFLQLRLLLLSFDQTLDFLVLAGPLVIRCWRAGGGEAGVPTRAPIGTLLGALGSGDGGWDANRRCFYEIEAPTQQRYDATTCRAFIPMVPAHVALADEWGARRAEVERKVAAAVEDGPLGEVYNSHPVVQAKQPGEFTHTTGEFLSTS